MARWIQQPIDFINLLTSNYLMGGFRSGTLGTVHLDVKKRRLETAQSTPMIVGAAGNEVDQRNISLLLCSTSLNRFSARKEGRYVP
jgi:hypothetical protein